MSIDERIDGCLARGDIKGAATAAIEGYGPAIHGYLCSLLDPDDAADVFATFAEQLWRSLPSFRRECSHRAWAFRIARTAVGHFRRDPWRRRGERLPSTAASRLAASIVQSGMEAGGRRDRLWKLRAEMPEEDQTLLVLRVDKELEWDEIAAVLTEESAPSPRLRSGSVTSASRPVSHAARVRKGSSTDPPGRSWCRKRTLSFVPPPAIFPP